MSFQIQTVNIARFKSVNHTSSCYQTETTIMHTTQEKKGPTISSYHLRLTILVSYINNTYANDAICCPLAIDDKEQHKNKTVN